MDATSSQIKLSRRLFQEGVEKGFYAKVSRVGELWLELDVHFLSLGGGEVALGWWFEVCLIPYLSDVEKLKKVKSISIVTGYGKTRTRGRRHGDDGMRKRVKAMLKHMHMKEEWQENAGRIYVDKEQLVAEVNKNGGKIIFDLAAYNEWKELETTANIVPEVEQKIRARFKPKHQGSKGPPFIRIENESTSEEYRLGRRRGVLEIDVSGPDYRSDIDYAARDGIRFAAGGRRIADASIADQNPRANTVGDSPRKGPDLTERTNNDHPEHNSNQSTAGREVSDVRVVHKKGSWNHEHPERQEYGNHHVDNKWSFEKPLGGRQSGHLSAHNQQAQPCHHRSRHAEPDGRDRERSSSYYRDHERERYQRPHERERSHPDYYDSRNKSRDNGSFPRRLNRHSDDRRGHDDQGYRPEHNFDDHDRGRGVQSSSYNRTSHTGCNYYGPSHRDHLSATQTNYDHDHRQAGGRNYQGSEHSYRQKRGADDSSRAERRTSNDSRGYAVEHPTAQRRRLS